MKKRMICIGLICMFLLTTMVVGTEMDKTTPQKMNGTSTDLQLTLRTRTSWGNPTGIEAILENTGTETVYGPITVTLKIKRGLGIMYKYEDETYTIVASDKYIGPGKVIYGAEWEPDPSITPGGIFTFKYILNYEDSNPDNNIDSHRFLVIHFRLFWFGRPDY